LFKDLSALQGNLGKLLRHYTGTMHESLEGLQTAADAIGGGQSSMLEQILKLKNRFHVMFAEMKSMLARIHPGQDVIVTRALDAFGTRMSQFDLGANHSDALQEFSAHAARLMATIHGASSHSVSKAAQVAHQVVTALHWINKDARDSAEAVRNYRSDAFQGKKSPRKIDADERSIVRVRFARCNFAAKHNGIAVGF
jgi:hypothetical protein